MIVLFAVSVLVVLPGVSRPVSACSLAQVEFDEAVWVDSERFVATFGFDVVRFDLSNGVETSKWSGGFFHRLAGDPIGDHVAVRVQEGLGGDCSGDLYLDLWDQKEGERLDRITGGYGPLAGSEAGLLAGHETLLEVSLFPWNTLSERRTIETGLPEEVFDRMYRYALAYPDDGSHLVALPEDPPRLFWVVLDPQVPETWHVDLLEEAFEHTPEVAFEPTTRRLALQFTADGRDRVLLFDLDRPEEGFKGLMNAPSPEEERRQSRSVAWTQEGIAVVGGDRVRHVDLQGGLAEVVIEGTTVRNVVASPHGPSWVVLVEDWDDGHQVIRYVGDGVVTSQWRYKDEAWQLVHPAQWAHLSSAQQDDPSWEAAGPVEGGPQEESPYVPGPGAIGTVVLLAGAAFCLHRRRC